MNLHKFNRISESNPNPNPNPKFRSTTGDYNAKPFIQREYRAKDMIGVDFKHKIRDLELKGRFFALLSCFFF